MERGHGLERNYWLGVGSSGWQHLASVRADSTGSIADRTGLGDHRHRLSDHIPVTVNMRCLRNDPHSTARRRLPCWVARHTDFKSTFRALYDELLPEEERSQMDAISHLRCIKEVLCLSATEIIKNAKTTGHNSPEEKHYWSTKALRASAHGDFRTIQSATTKVPDIRQFFDDDHNLIDQDGLCKWNLALCNDVQHLRLQQCNNNDDANGPNDRTDHNTDNTFHNYKSERIVNWLKRQSQRRNKTSATILEGLSTSVPIASKEAADLLTEHWGPIFQPKGIDIGKAKNLLANFTARLPSDLNWDISRGDFLKLLAKVNGEASSGPDGVPACFWQTLDADLKLLFAHAVTELAANDDTTIPDGFNHAYMIYLCKKQWDSKIQGHMATNSSNTRTISLSNSDSKIIAAATCMLIRRHRNHIVDSDQSGLDADRDCARNILEVEAAMLQKALTFEDGMEPAAFFLDFCNAFPALDRAHALSDVPTPASWWLPLLPLH